MWQRFTEKARKIVFYAQEAAQKYGHKYVSTEHLLLGLIRETDNVACKALTKMGISLDMVKAKVEQRISLDREEPPENMTLTPRGKRVIDRAYDEARNLNNNYIGSEHLLLGLIREADGIAGIVLSELGVELERARREVMALQEEESARRQSDSPESNYTPARHQWAQKAPVNLVESLLFQIRRGGHTSEFLAAAAMARGSAGAALIDDIGGERGSIALALEMQAEQRGMPQPVSIDSILSSATRFVAEGNTLNSAHLLAAVAAEGCTIFNAVLGDAGTERLKEKIAQGPF